MAIAMGDLLQIVDNQTYLGEDLMNVYYFRWFSAPTLDNTAYIPLLEDFWEIVGEGVRQLQVEQVLHTTVEIKNLSNGVDFGILPINLNGDVPAEPDQCLPSYLTLGFQMFRDSLVTRNGYKRYSGIVEDWVDGNTLIDGVTEIGNMELGLSRNLHIGILEVAAPVIVKRPIDPPVGDTYIYSSVTSALFKGIGTQNSRKP